MAALRILLVEDNALLARTLSDTLREVDGIELIASAASEEAAIRLLRSAPGAYDLIVVDIFLSSGSGLAVLRAARVLQPAARVTMLTNYATLDVRKSCIRLGADRVFDKARQTEDFLAYCEELAGHTLHHDVRDEGPATVPLE